MNRADAVLSRANPDIDLLVLPEMAFSGEQTTNIAIFIPCFPLKILIFPILKD